MIVRSGHVLEIPSPSLFLFYRDEQRLKVALAKALAALALEYFVKNRRAVLDRLCKDLQQIALVVAVDEYAELLKVLDVLVDAADAFRQLVVICVGDGQKLDAVGLQLGDRRADVAAEQGDMLGPGRA